MRYWWDFFDGREIAEGGANTNAAGRFLGAGSVEGYHFGIVTVLLRQTVFAALAIAAWTDPRAFVLSEETLAL
jgi:hypothetical protein